MELNLTHWVTCKINGGIKKQVLHIHCVASTEVSLSVCVWVGGGKGKGTNLIIKTTSGQIKSILQFIAKQQNSICEGLGQTM